MYSSTDTNGSPRSRPAGWSSRRAGSHHTFGISLLHLAVQRAVLEQPLADFFGQLAVVQHARGIDARGASRRR
jgi:hypothetical protein